MKSLLMVICLLGFVGSAEASWRVSRGIGKGIVKVSKVSPYHVVKYTGKGIGYAGKGAFIGTMFVAEGIGRHI